MRSTGDLERDAADRLGPIVERTLRELGLGADMARPLMRRVAEAYMSGRADGLTVPPHRANGALSAEGIAIALALQHGPATSSLSPIGAGAGGLVEPESLESSEHDALEVMAGRLARTVTVEAAVGWDDPEHLAHLLAALGARPESLEPPAGAEVRRRVIGVTLTVEAESERAAREIATRALIDEMVRLGLV